MYPEIKIAGLVIRCWDFLAVLSYFVVTALLLLNRPKDYPGTRVQIFWGTIIFFFLGIVGAVLLHLLLYADKYRHLPLLEAISMSGTAYLGIPILGLLGVFIYCRELKVSFLTAVDYVAPYLMLERVLGRLGCLLNGCCYGIPSHLPWAQNFGDGLLRHPTQAYALIAALAIFISGILTYYRLKEFNGAIFFMVAALYAFMRFFNEFLRVDSPVIFGPFYLSHIAIFIIFLFGIAGLYSAFRRTEQKKQLRAGIMRMLYLFLLSLLVGAAVILTALSLIKNLLL